MNLLQIFFITVVNMSITASYVAIGIILVRLLLKKTPKFFSYILWAPLLFRLLCPITFNSGFSFLSIFNLLNPLNLNNLDAVQESGSFKFIPQNLYSMDTNLSDTHPIQTSLLHTPVIQYGSGGMDNTVNASIPAAVSAAGINSMQMWISVLSFIWITGVIVLLTHSIISYLKTKRKLQTATRVRGNIFETDAVSTAFVFGLIRPKIYVPVNMRDEDLPCILEHECTHIRRKDYLVKPIAYFALILHWFNPLMWLCFTLMSRDMEMSCDENVLIKLGDGAKGSYSYSLLSMSVKRKGILTANPLAFGECHVKTRIKNILGFKKPSIWLIVVAAIAVCAAAIAFAANPNDNSKYASEYISEIYKISLRYPSYWKLNPNHTKRYEGKDGFFQIGAVYGEGMTIDEAAKNNAYHKLNPYGSDPQIINRIIDGQEARLIMPSSDQPVDMQDQAGLIVKYPETVKIGNSTYHYFILWADKAHIERIGDTLTFLNKQTEEQRVNQHGNQSAEQQGEQQEQQPGKQLENQSGEQTENQTEKQAENESSPDNSAEAIAKLVEENLAIIISSPKEASNLHDYIQAHKDEYENIKKFGGEEALQYMLSRFRSGDAEGLRGYIMMQLCKELLGVRNNVTDEALTPQEWYNALAIRQEIRLPDFKYDGNDPIEKLVYATEIEKNSRSQEGFTIVAPKIFGSYEEKGFLKVFVTTFSVTYKLYGNVLDEVGGSVVPSAITYRKDNNGNYVLEKYEQAKDGAYWKPSIKEFCTMPVSGRKIPGLAEKIIKHYADRDDIRTLQWENLFKHLKSNGIKDATLFDPYGEIEFTMSKPKYIN